MSHPLLPKNLNRDNALFRQGKPDYTKLEADPFPTPTADEASAILENSDTGTRYRWTGTKWLQQEIPKDYFVEVSEGNINGAVMVQFTGTNLSIGNSTRETLWDQGGNYNWLTTDTELFVSSTSASDTAVTLAVVGLDDNYLEVTRVVVLNGQTQVAVVGDMFRIYALVVISDTTPLGEVYLAESDTLTGGVPNTASKIQSKIPLSAGEVGIYASNNISHNGFYTVPAGKTLRGLILFMSSPRGDDIHLQVRFRGPTGSAAFLLVANQFVYQSLGSLNFLNRGPIAEKSDVEFRVLASNPNGMMEINFEFVMVDN